MFHVLTVRLGSCTDSDGCMRWAELPTNEVSYSIQYGKLTVNVKRQIIPVYLTTK